jgi:AraC-like DNA-binding protein
VETAVLERQAASGVLLVTECVADLVPLQIALESKVRAATMNFKAARASNFAASVIVIDARPEYRFDDVHGIRLKFPNASVVLLCAPNSTMQDLGDIRPSALFTKPLHLPDVLVSVQQLAHVSGRPLPPTVVMAVELMSRRYREKLTVAHIAAAVGLSERRFTHIFRESTGLSVNDYFNKFRVAIARRLLIESDAKLDSIAELAGFSDSSNFSRAFTEIAGIRPGRFRQRGFEDNLAQ